MLSALHTFCGGNSPWWECTDKLPSQTTSNEKLWCVFVVSLNKLQNKQSSCRWYETFIQHRNAARKNHSSGVHTWVRQRTSLFCHRRQLLLKNQTAAEWWYFNGRYMAGSPYASIFMSMWQLVVQSHVARLGTQSVSKCGESSSYHDNVIKWRHFPRYWSFVRGIHRSPVNSPHKGQWRGALMFSLIWALTNGWVNNRNADDLGCQRAHYDVTVMICLFLEEGWILISLKIHVTVFGWRLIYALDIGNSYNVCAGSRFAITKMKCLISDRIWCSYSVSFSEIGSCENHICHWYISWQWSH